MQKNDPLVLVPESRLRALLDESVERVARRVLRGAADPAAADRPGKEWLTNQEAMDYLGLSRPTLARYRKSKKLPFSKVGGSVYYRRVDVVALLAANVQRPEE